jgi:predicted Mrr-cat superfamily restriction endonuclease
MRRAWIVRAGETRREIDAMREAGLVGVRFEAVPDVRDMTPLDIERALAAAGATGVEALRSRLMRFAAEVGIGDLVVVPNLSQHELWIADVTGPYEYVAEPAVAGFQHVRTAEWIGWVDRNASWLQHKTKYLEVSGAVVELRDAPWWFDQVATHDLPKERPLTARAAAAAAKPARTPRTPRSTEPKAPPKPKPTEPQRVLCAGQCGLQWSTAVLVDGLCPDCRGD